MTWALVLSAALAAPRIVTPGEEAQTTRERVRLYAMVAPDGVLTLTVDGKPAGRCRAGTPAHCEAPVPPGRHDVTLSDGHGSVTWKVTRYVTTGRLPQDVELEGGFGRSPMHRPEIELVCASCHPMDDIDPRALEVGRVFGHDGGALTWSPDGGVATGAAALVVADGGALESGAADGGVADGGADGGVGNRRNTSLLGAPCMACHRETVTRRYQHGPVGQGMCLRCHDPASNPRYAVEWPIRDTCFHCHKDIQGAMEGKAFRHGPPAQGRCTTCHDPHGSDNPFWLKLKPFDLCTNCHPEKRRDRHVVVGFVYGDAHPTRDRPHPRKPGADFACPSCHNPHAAQSRYLWQFDATRKEALCRTCHPK